AIHTEVKMGVAQAIVDIGDEFRLNLARVEELVETYTLLKTSSSAGPHGQPAVAGRATATTDVLRAAVVFLHATMEDLYRRLEELMLPHQSDKEPLKAIGFPVGNNRKDKIDLAWLARQGGTSSIHDVVRNCVTSWLEKRT